MADVHGQAHRVRNIATWSAVAVFAVVIVIAGLSWQTHSYNLLILAGTIWGASILIVRFARSAIVLLTPRETLEPTEWMRRGGLMASPEASARPDGARISSALTTLPNDFPAQDRDAVEAYLAMPDDDEKQLCRDRLIREFYERAGSEKLDFNHRRAYNALRLALSPWADPGSDS